MGGDGRHTGEAAVFLFVWLLLRYPNIHLFKSLPPTRWRPPFGVRVAGEKGLENCVQAHGSLSARMRGCVFNGKPAQFRCVRQSLRVIALCTRTPAPHPPPSAFSERTNDAARVFIGKRETMQWYFWSFMGTQTADTRPHPPAKLIEKCQR